MSDREERVVEIDLDDSGLERRAPKTLSLLEKLNEALTFKKTKDEAAKSAKSISNSINGANFNTIQKALDTLNKKFSALGVASATAVSRVTNDIITMGRNMYSSLIEAPVRDGFSEYEQKMGSIQTIMASSKRPLKEVKDTLEELNKYSDDTIYSFADMTSSIGKFTNAGVKLEDATLAIKGISNEAALSGANTNEASRAMFNFAQALSSGSVKLIDWMSIENANMATVEFKQTLIDTAVEMGTLTKEINGMYKTVTTNAKGSTSDAFDAVSGFRDNLSYQWLTADVLIKTLGKYADTTQDIGRRAQEAATQVKTFSQFMDNTKEAIGSGWAMTFEYIIGDFNQAKNLWTDLAKFIGDVVDKSADSRNGILKDWEALGGRIALIEAIKNAWAALAAVGRPVKEAFNNVFPPLTGEKLFQMTVMLRTFTENLIIGAKTADALRDTFEGLFAIIDIFTMITSGGLTLAFRVLEKVIEASGSDILQLTATVGRAIKAFDDWLWENKYVNAGIDFLADKISSAISAIVRFKDAIKESGAAQVIWTNAQNAARSAIDVFRDILPEATEAFKDFIISLTSMDKITVGGIFDSVITLFRSLITIFRDGASTISSDIKGSFAAIPEAINLMNVYLGGAVDKTGDILSRFHDILFDSAGTFKIGLGEIAAVLAGYGAIKVGKQIDRFIGVLEGLAAFPKSLAGVIGAASNALNTLAASMKELSKAKSFAIKMEGLLTIAKAILVFASAIAVLAVIPREGIIQAGIAVAGIIASLVILSKVLKKLDTKDAIKMSVGMAGMAVAMLIAGRAIKKLADIPWKDLLKGFLAMIATLGVFIAAVKLLNGSEVRSQGVILSLSVAIVSLSFAMKKLAEVNAPLKALTNALIGVGTLVLISKAAKKVDAVNLTGVLAMSAGLLVLTFSLKRLSKADPAKLLKGLGYMALIMLEFAVLNRLGGRIQVSGGFGRSVLSMSLSLLAFAGALKILSGLNIRAFDNIDALLVRFTLTMGSLISFSRLAGNNAVKAGLMITMITASLMMLSVAAVGLGHVDTGVLAKGVAAVSALMTVAGLTIKIASVGENGVKKIMGLTAVIGALVIATVALSLVPTKKALVNTAGISSMLLGLAATLKATEKADFSIKTVGKILLLLSVLATITEILNLLPINNDKSIQAVGAVSTLMVALSACCVIISKSSSVAGTALAAIAELGLIAAGLIGVLYLARGIDGRQAIEVATAVSEMMLVISAVTAVCGVIGKFGGAAAIAQGALGLAAVVGVMGVIAAFFTAINELASAISQEGPGFLTDRINDAIPLARAIGDFFGEIIGGVVGGVVNGFNETAFKSLGVVGESFAAFGMALKDVPKGVGETAKDLSVALLALTGADLLSGIASIFKGGVNFKKIGQSFASLGACLTGFTEHVKGINNWEQVEPAAKAIKMLAEAASTIPNSGGVAGFFAGENDLQDFANQMYNASGALVKFIEKASAIEDWSPAVEVAKALTAMAKAASEVPNAGGVLAYWAGENSITQFAIDMEKFIETFKRFIGRAMGVKDYSPAIQVAKSLTAMAKAAQVVPNTGGVLGKWVGNNDLDTFGKQMSSFGEDFKDFTDDIAGIKNWDAPISAAKCLVEMAKAAKEVPNTGGVLGKFVGNNDLGDFGTGMQQFGLGLHSLAANVAGISTDTWTSMSASAKLLTEFANAAKDIPNEGGIFDGLFSKDRSLKDFGEELVSFGDSVADFSLKLAGHSLTEFMTFSASFGNVMNNLTGGGLEEATSSIVRNGDIIVEKTRDVMFNVNKAISDNIKNVFQNGRLLGGALANGLKDRYGDVVDSAKFLMTGLKKGLTAKEESVKKAMRDVGSGLKDEFNDELDIHSPSKWAIASAGLVMKGLSKGIDTSKIEPIKKVEDVAEEIKSELSNATPDYSNITSGITDVAEETQSLANTVKTSGNDISTSAAKTSTSVTKSTVKTKSKVEEFRDTVKGTVTSATRLFDEFTAAESKGTKEIIKNLKGQISSIKDWYNGLETLKNLGVSKALLKEFAEMGPESVTYVRQMIAMTDKELKQVDSLYKKRLKLNSRSADEIVKTLYDTGAKAGSAYQKGFSDATTKNTGQASAKGTASTVSSITSTIASAVSKMSSILSFDLKSSVKGMASTMDYGGKVLKQFSNLFLSNTNNFKIGSKVLKESTKAIQDYANALYKSSEYYAEDNAALKAAKKERDSYNKALTASQKTLKSTQNSMVKEQQKLIKGYDKNIAKYSKQNSASAKYLVKAYKEQKKIAEQRIKDIKAGTDREYKTKVKATKATIKEQEKLLKSSNKAIAELEKQQAEHTAQVFNELISTISDSVKSFLDPLRVSVDSGVDLFTKFETAQDRYKAAQAELIENQKKLEELRKKEKAYLENNTVAYRSAADAQGYSLGEIRGMIEETQKAIEDNQNTMSENSQITAKSILESMDSQVAGVKKWQNNLNQLKKRGLTAGLLEELRELGPSGADYVNAFMTMTGNQLKEANKKFEESAALSGRTIIDSFSEQLTKSKTWSKNLAKMAEMGFSQDLISKITSEGIESTYDIVAGYVSMTESELVEFKRLYADSLKVPDTVANQAVASMSYAGAQSRDAFVAAMAELSKNGSNANKTLKANAQAIADVIGEAINGIGIGNATVSNIVKGISQASSDKKSMSVLKSAAAVIGKGVTDTMSTNVSKAKGKAIAIQMLDGLSNGLKGKQATKAAKEMAAEIVDTIKKELKIKSPSRIMEDEVGANIDAGTERGIRKNASSLYEAASDVASNVAQLLSQFLDDGFDISPTITPVIDLSEIQNGVTGASGLLNTLSASTSMSLASSAAARAKTANSTTVLDVSSIKSLLKDIESKIGTSGDITIENEFNLSGSDPTQIANEVSVILQRQVERRNAIWA